VHITVLEHPDLVVLTSLQEIIDLIDVGGWWYIDRE
jgi:hypothetical protein